MADVTRRPPESKSGQQNPEQKLDSSTESDKQRLDRVRQQTDEIIKLCNNLKLGESKDIANIDGIPKLCQLLKQLAVLSDLKLDSDITGSPEDFSCLLKLLKKHQFGNRNIDTCCKIVERLLTISGFPYSNQQQAELLKASSNLLSAKGSIDKAVVPAKAFVELASELGDKKLEAEAYYTLIKLYASKRVLTDEIKFAVEKCVQCSKESEDELTICYSKHATAILHSLEQNYEQARAEGEEFLDIANRLNDREAMCAANLYLAGIYYALFNVQKAIDLSSKGVKLATQLGYYKTLLQVQLNQNSMYTVLGQYKESFKLGKAMLKNVSRYDDKHIWFTILCNQSVCTLMLHEHPDEPFKYANESLRLARESLMIAEKMGEPRLIALAHGNIGLAHEKLQDYESAIKSFEKCLESGITSDDKRVINNGYCNLGRAYEGKGDKETAKKHYLEAYNMEAQPLSSHLVDTEDFRFSSDYHLGRIAVEEHDYSAAEKYFQEVVDRCEKLRKSVHESSLKICFNDTQKKPFQYLQHVLLKNGAETAALLVGEMGRGRDFYDKVIKEDEAKRLNTPDALIELVKTNNQAVLFLSKLDVAGEMLMWFITPDGNVSSFLCPLKKWEDVLEELRTIFSEILSGGRCSPEAQSNPEEAIEFRGVDNPVSDDESGDESDDGGKEDESKRNRTDTKSRTRAPPPVVPLPPTKTIYDFFDLIDRFSEIIVRPIESHLESLVSKSGSKPELLIIPQGQTFNIPYAALRLKSKKPLCSVVSPREAFSFHSYFYSTTLQQEAQPLQMEDVLIVGNPTNDLKFAEEEAKMIAEKLKIIPLLNNSATRSEVLHRLPQAPIIHFACHGTIDGKSLKLALKESNNNDENLLTVEDISNLSLQANMVVLSACHTARGRISSEGVLGLARAFLMAGAKSVVTALWSVKDHATKEFMLKFYSNLSTQPVVDALATTMCEMENDKFNVTHWGSFKVLGANVKVFN